MAYPPMTNGLAERLDEAVAHTQRCGRCATTSADSSPNCVVATDHLLRIVDYWADRLEDFARAR